MISAPLATGSGLSLFAIERSGRAGVGVFVGVSAGRGVAVAGRDVAVAGRDVAVGGRDVAVAGTGVAVGARIVSVPLLTLGMMGDAAVFVRMTPERVSPDVPAPTVVNWTVLRTPDPFGPDEPPVEKQAKETTDASTMGEPHEDDRPVEPRKPPFPMELRARTLESHDSAKP